MDYREELLNACKRYCEATGKAQATVATLVMNDGKFFDRMLAGKGCTVDTYKKVMQWFKENTPRTRKAKK